VRNIRAEVGRLRRDVRARGLDRPPPQTAEDMSDEELLAHIERGPDMHDMGMWLARHRRAISEVPGGPTLIARLTDLLAGLPAKHPKNLLAVWRHMEEAKLADAFLQVFVQLRETEVEQDGGRRAGGGA
jgi:hypothetical protein